MIQSFYAIQSSNADVRLSKSFVFQGVRDADGSAYNERRNAADNTELHFEFA